MMNLHDVHSLEEWVREKQKGTIEFMCNGHLTGLNSLCEFTQERFLDALATLKQAGYCFRYERVFCNNDYHGDRRSHLTELLKAEGVDFISEKYQNVTVEGIQLVFTYLDTDKKILLEVQDIYNVVAGTRFKYHRKDGQNNALFWLREQGDSSDGPFFYFWCMDPNYDDSEHFKRGFYFRILATDVVRHKPLKPIPIKHVDKVEWDVYKMTFDAEGIDNEMEYLFTDDMEGYQQWYAQVEANYRINRPRPINRIEFDKGYIYRERETELTDIMFAASSSCYWERYHVDQFLLRVRWISFQNQYYQIAFFHAKGVCVVEDETGSLRLWVTESENRLPHIKEEIHYVPNYSTETLESRQSSVTLGDFQDNSICSTCYLTTAVFSNKRKMLKDIQTFTVTESFLGRLFHEVVGEWREYMIGDYYGDYD